MEERIDIYQRVTNQIIAAIEAGAGDWKMPWHTQDGAACGLPVNLASRQPYRGVNTLILWATAQELGYSSAVWGTYKQWAERGCQVRKGEKSTCIVFWKVFE